MRTVLWVAFAALIVGFLALDLGVLHRRARQVSLREAFGWSVFWVILALVFGGVLFFWRGTEIALQFVTGYLIEKALSVDILFVFMLILGYFQVPQQFQHTVLFWGIVGALVMRFVLIALGLSLIETFHWVLYVFGAFLVLTGVRLFFQGDRPVEPERNLFVRAMRRVLPMSEEYAGTRFVTRRGGRLMATPLLPALVAVESTDLVFALDSIPAVLAVTRDPLVVYSANVFALLGMRALYFALSGIMPFFHYLRYAFAAILVLAGARMLLAEWYEVPVTAVLAAVVALLFVTMVASVVRPRASQIEALLAQGRRTGEFQPEQVKLVERVFELGDRRIASLMTPRPDIVWLDADDDRAELAKKLRSVSAAQIPVARRSLDDVLGVVDVHELLATVLGGDDLDLPAGVRPPLLVSEHAPSLEVLESFRDSGADAALVVDEYGTVKGMVTLRDIVDAATRPTDASGTSKSVSRTPDGDGWVVDAAVPVDEFTTALKMEPVTPEERAAHHTVAGLALRQIGRLPAKGDRFTWRGLAFEVLKVQHRRIRTLRVERADKDKQEAPDGEARTDSTGAPS